MVIVGEKRENGLVIVRYRALVTNLLVMVEQRFEINWL